MFFLNSLQKISIKKRLVSLLFINLISFLLLGFIQIYFMNEQKKESYSYRELVDQTREVQVGFKKQVQEWKNILLRGDKDFIKYKNQFISESNKIDKRLEDLQAKWKLNQTLLDSFQKLIKQKSELDSKYNIAILKYDPSNHYQSSKETDQMVKGMDRSFNDNLDELVNISKQTANTEIENLIKKNQLITFIILGIGLFYSIIINYFTIRSIHEPIEYSKRIVNEISKGNLADRIQVTGTDEIGILQESINKMADNISNLLSLIKQNLQTHAKSTNDLRLFIDDYRQNTEELNLSIENETNTLNELFISTDKSEKMILFYLEKIEEINSTLNFVLNTQKEYNSSLESLNKTNDLSNKNSLDGKEMITTLLEFVEDTKNSFSKIFQVTSIIQNISKETNLLSLNASIESARAGKEGLGFAVVSENIARLARESMQQVTEIKSFIDNANFSFQRVIQVTIEIEKLFTKLLNNYSKNDSIVKDFVKIAKEQNHSILNISSNIYEFKEISKDLKSNLDLERDFCTNLKKEIKLILDASQISNSKVSKISNLIEELNNDAILTKKNIEQYSMKS
jgi:methyl-accepting chemotaxis protein